MPDQADVLPPLVVRQPRLGLGHPEACSIVARRNATASTRATGAAVALVTKYFTSPVASLIAATRV